MKAGLIIAAIVALLAMFALIILLRRKHEMRKTKLGILGLQDPADSPGGSRSGPFDSSSDSMQTGTVPARSPPRYLSAVYQDLSRRYISPSNPFRRTCRAAGFHRQLTQRMQPRAQDPNTPLLPLGAAAEDKRSPRSSARASLAEGQQSPQLLDGRAISRGPSPQFLDGRPVESPKPVDDGVDEKADGREDWKDVALFDGP